MPNRTYTPGERVRFRADGPEGEVWQVSRVSEVTDPWTGDPEYHQRLSLVIRNANGAVRNCCTGVRNTELVSAEEG
ncbi:MAG: hypothetical protein M3315_11920 [Actinomycetota bacterium]|nr:hypothetical protein [Actinomycetota bacterium]